MKKPTAQPNFPKFEQEQLRFWQKNNIFKRSEEKNQNQEKFVFYEGPPTANGKPHIGHVLARSYKDLFPRFKTMRGFYVKRKAGWDSHGLPVELEVEKKLGISGKEEIEEFGIEKFNQLCRESVFEYIGAWEKMTRRMAYWVDLDNPYVVLDKDYIESLWWVLGQIWDKGLLRKDYKVVPYCPRCQTPLSSHELSQGYKDNVRDPSVFVKFKLRSTQAARKLLGNQLNEAYLLAWTTTPWTLLGNVALAVDPAADYAAVKTDDEILILAKQRLDLLEEDYQVLQGFSGQQMAGLEYEPVFSYLNHKQKAHYVVTADFVDLSEGTGVVHTAVMYGEDDFKLGTQHNLPKKHIVNQEGKFLPVAKDFAGQSVWEVTGKVISALSDKNRLYKSKTLRHRYPFCWRCKSKIIYYALESWFISMTKVKDRLLKNNQQVNWYPAHIKEGRMGNWLQNVKDWSISRWRYWGTPLPIWRCEDCEQEELIDCYDKLRERSVADLDLETFDPHRPYIDKVKLDCQECSGQMKRYEDVIDTWFDSGGMPYAQWHYPFENGKIFGQQFPADFICEGVDQTRGWFYTLLAEATALDKQAPYKNVLVTEMVLDKKGQKMSKSVGNVLDPGELFEEFGADALRWYFYSTSQIGKTYHLGRQDLTEIHKRFLNILWHSYRFVVTNALLDGYKPKRFAKYQEARSRSVVDQDLILDNWILSRTQNLLKQVTERLEGFDAYRSSRAILDFVVNDFSQWYIRSSRERVGPNALRPETKGGFYQTSFYVLQVLVRILAPFTPFVAEKIYQNIRHPEDLDSIHLADWPLLKTDLMNKELETKMRLVRELAEKIHAARKTAGIKLRQPLAKARVTTVQEVELEKSLFGLLKGEVNLKDLEFTQDSRQDKPKVELDTQLTKELRQEGLARELARELQRMRKKAGYDQRRSIKVVVETNSDLLRESVQKHQDLLRKRVLASQKIQMGSVPTEKEADLIKQTTLDDQNATLSIQAI